MTDQTTYTWAFGGPLAGAPPEAAWTVLALVAGACAVFAWSSYRTAMVRLGLAPSFLFMTLRLGCLLALLFCLANPVRIERSTALPPEPPAPPPPPAPPTLAVLIDRSDSMVQADNRGRTRLDGALVTWRRIEKVAENHFAPPRYYSFAKDLKPAATLDEALARTGDTEETDLYRSIVQLLQNPPEGAKPDAIVVLTDGLDTTNSPEAQVSEAAVAAGVPVYFIAGTNRSVRTEPFLRVREWRAPATVMQNSQFALEGTFEAFSRTDRTETFSLWLGSQRIARGELRLTTGTNLLQQTFPMNAGDPGTLDVALRLGDAADSPVAARSITRILDRRPIRVLVFQGALDWGFRYLTDALRTDPNFELFTIVTPGTGLVLSRAGLPDSTALGRLPEKVESLEPFDCIVLARPYPSIWNDAQQQTLIEFVRRGGSVLFVSPDPEAAAQFVASPLKEILPVRLGAPTPPLSGAARSATGVMQRVRRVLTDETPPELLPFQLTEAGKESPIFARAKAGEGTLVPKFVEYFPAIEAKPATEILAVHPTPPDPVSGKPHILLATLPYGRGRTAVITTDSLWRWKLDEPSTVRVVETFWQQLLLTIGRRSPPEALRFANAPSQVREGETKTLLLAGVGPEKQPTVAAKSPSNVISRLEVKLSGDADAPWAANWTPDEPGAWELVALFDDALRAHAFPAVVTEAVGELARTDPPLDALRALAGETGGTLLTHEAPATWRVEATDSGETNLEPVTSERTFLRWNTWYVLYIALGFFAAELLLRRVWKLL